MDVYSASLPEIRVPIAWPRTRKNPADVVDSALRGSTTLWAGIGLKLEESKAMRYMLMVKATQDFEAGVWPDEKTLAEMAKFTEALVQAGAMVACERLTPSTKGARVRYSKQKTSVIDGPFAETKELIAGICLIEAKSLEEAVGWAKRIPFRDGEVDVRPIFDLADVLIAPDDQNALSSAAAPPARRPGTVRYMALVKADRDSEAGLFPDEKSLTAMGRFLDEGTKAGILLTGEGLQPSSKSARVRYSGKERLVLDGPFAETKELVAGYMIVQFASRAEAIEWTKRFVQVDAPGRYQGQCECEIRPIFEFAEFGAKTVEQFHAAGAP
jgi:hypothetical protein